MPSTLEEMAVARRAARAGRRTQANAVLDLDDIIVLSVEQEQRRLVGADMAYGRIERLARRVGTSPEQLFAAAGLGNGRVHRPHRRAASARISSRHAAVHTNDRLNAAGGDARQHDGSDQTPGSKAAQDDKTREETL